MDVYIYPIATAVALFPVLSAIFTLPYVIDQYHKYGALLVLRIIIVYSFIFYMMTSYFMTILPLPPVDSVVDGGTYMLLVPFNAGRLWLGSSGLVWNDISTYRSAFINYNFFQIAFNVLLLVPFGVYLRYYFERKWYQVILLSFTYSLFFELTQLSGLYGIYPHAYRWFEVDDLICNTLGGFVGFLVTPVCSFFLPTRDRLDEMSYHKGMRVSFFRKMIANILDWGLVLVILLLFRKYVWSGESFETFVLDYRTRTLFIITGAYFIYHVLSSWIMRGRTIGKYFVSLKVKSDSGEKTKLYQYVIRYGIVYLIIFPTPAYIIKLMEIFENYQNVWVKTACSVVISAFIIYFLFFVLNTFIATVLHHSQASFEKLSHTLQVSTVKEIAKNVEENAPDEVNSPEEVNASDEVNAPDEVNASEEANGPDDSNTKGQLK